MAKIELHPAKPDEWLRPIMDGFKMACCDCGLIHSVDFRIQKGRVYMRARRMKQLTKKFRKQEGVFYRELKHASEKDQVAFRRGYRSRHPDTPVSESRSAVRDEGERKVLRREVQRVSRRTDGHATHRGNQGKGKRGQNVPPARRTKAKGKRKR